MARWTIDQQIEKIDEKIKELQGKKKELIAAKKKPVVKKAPMKNSELKQLKKLKDALEAKGFSPDQFNEVIDSIK